MSAVRYTSSDRVGVITLNRPDARNAVDREMALGFETAVDRLDLGLVSRLVEPGAAIDEARRVAQRIVAAAPLAVQASRRIVLAVGSS